MADPITITTALGSAVKACVALHSAIRGFGDQNKDVRALKAEISGLRHSLNSLKRTIETHASLDFGALQQPLQLCGTVCEDYGQIIARCTGHSDDATRPSVQGWMTQTYLQGENDFRAMLAAYKSTINIALANANIRIAAISPEVLEQYKDMISDATYDLTSHLQDMQQKIDRLNAENATAVDDMALEEDALLGEKESTKQGLDMCTRLSAQLAQFQATSVESAGFPGRPSAHKYIKRGLSKVGRSIQGLEDRLQTHEVIVSSQLEEMFLQEVLPKPIASQLDRLQKMKESLDQCICIVSDARELAYVRGNVFEDLTLANNKYALSVSRVGDFSIDRRLNITGGSQHFGGQVTNETVQRSIKALIGLDMEHVRSSAGTHTHQQPQRTTTEVSVGARFEHRFGPGRTCS
ncbi:hypothetical protein LX36DRAFT_648413 [Colletotrichum falcatum]|nr:hypothetical protein LX36DRAFT_648413 [Colletotrichum falcatum]